MRRIVTALLTIVAAVLATVGLPGTPAHAAAWTPRPEDYSNTVTQKDLAIPMDDGTILRGDLTLPADASGKAIDAKFPVIVTITAYNKSSSSVPGIGNVLTGADPTYLVKRGYAQLTVDARGTGSSEGSWCAFCTREDQDFGEVMTWAHNQPWSNGDTAMSGPSYMGIDQIFAAAEHPPGLKAIFPQVPAADVYRDVVASGGQLDVGFIPLWLGLVTLTGIIPPATPDPVSDLTALIQHVEGALSFSGTTLVGAATGGEAAYDGPFYAQRSPINVINDVDVPAFFVSGEYDLFQRGTPLLFENLQQRGIPTKMIIGPWNHLQASAGDGIDQAGYGDLSELQLRWFDHYVKGMPDPGLDSPGGDIAPITYYEQGTGAWRTAQKWVDPADTQATVLPLAGSATASTPGRLGTAPTGDGVSPVYPIPVSGLCSRSSDQWTAGLASELQVFNDPCFNSDTLNDGTATRFQTAPLTHDLPIFGPINAHLYVDSSSGDGMLSVAVNDVAPDGSVTRLTGGWQVISMRQLDTSRTRYLDGQDIQPYHPFTQASVSPAAPGQVVPVDVEVFPTGADIQAGHRLEIAVQAFDVPHLLPTLTQALGVLTVMNIHASAVYPSELILPTRDKVTHDATATPAGAPTAGTPAGTAVTSVAFPTVRVKVRGRNAIVRTDAPGRVRLWIDGHRIGTRALTHDKAVFRLPREHRGTHVVKGTYLGPPRASASTRWTVR